MHIVLFKLLKGLAKGIVLVGELVVTVICIGGEIMLLVGLGWMSGIGRWVRARLVLKLGLEFLSVVAKVVGNFESGRIQMIDRSVIHINYLILQLSTIY